MPKISFYFFLLAVLLGCQNEASEKFPKEAFAGNLNSTYHLLVFKKEQNVELWELAEKNKFIDSFKIIDFVNLPLGKFAVVHNNQQLNINLKNEFYNSKNYFVENKLKLDTKNLGTSFFEKIKDLQISKIIIFPNDNRKGGTLIPCFACPHWMAEMYAFLNLKKEEYF